MTNAEGMPRTVEKWLFLSVVFCANIRLMKRGAPVKGQTSAAKRRARLGDVVKKARAKGEGVPCGVKFISFRELKPAEVAHGKSLEKIARACLSRRRAVA